VVVALICSVVYGVVVGTFSGGGQYWAAPIKVAVSADFDEIRLGSTLLEAVTTVPEPGSLALAGIGAVFYGCHRRRRLA